ncbi:MAG: hypothetical protein WC444_04405 [Candidatus Paceibacterota bacterium]
MDAILAKCPFCGQQQTFTTDKLCQIGITARGSKSKMYRVGDAVRPGGMCRSDAKLVLDSECPGCHEKPVLALKGYKIGGMLRSADENLT